MKKLVGKIKCKLGWHNWTCKIKDYLDEFGYVPLDNRVPMNARCSKCNKIYGDGTSKKTR
jgi:hypothetical protein